MWGHFQSQQGGDDKARIPRIVGRVASLSLSISVSFLPIQNMVMNRI
jgi:hypothetical protein